MFNINFSAKIKEAEDRIREGEKHLQTSFFKRKPDIDSAIDEFEKACNCYRVAEQYEQCRDLGVRIAELQVKSEKLFFAAKSFEQVAQMTQQLKDLSKASEYFDLAGRFYAQSGIEKGFILRARLDHERLNILEHPDSGAILYERSAPIFQQFNRNISIDFYLKAADLAEKGHKAFQAADLYEKAAMQLIRIGDYQKTSEKLEMAIKILTNIERFDRINRLIFYRILLKLFNDDYVAARNIFNRACQQYSTFDRWEETTHIELLLDALDQGDKNLISQRCQQPYFMAIEPEFVRLIKQWICKLKPGRQSSNSITSSQTSYSRASSTSGIRPMQFDDDQNDLR